MQIQKRHHLLKRHDLARQLFVVLRQHRGELAQRGGQHAEKGGEGNQHHDNHNGYGHRAADTPAQKPGHQRVKHNGKKERQQKLDNNIGGSMDTGEDHHQRGEF